MHQPAYITPEEVTFYEGFFLVCIIFILSHVHPHHSRHRVLAEWTSLGQLWRYVLISLVTAAVLRGVTTWLKQHVMHHSSK
ncbi:hypothetical protein [Bacillus sp. AM 13(2015)]|uniref:hypothetical protein n=1 Tax=Bacillus sp. AM 13(2015) TaxID=1739115 RepID=UPI000A6F5CBA|nr:hypothetical protein [Bacillus sp. AM 13(2015)]